MTLEQANNFCDSIIVQATNIKAALATVTPEVFTEVSTLLQECDNKLDDCLMMIDEGIV
jgi:hypothetical protein